MKVEFEVTAIGRSDSDSSVDSFKKVELVRVHELSKSMTVAEIEELFSSLCQEVEESHRNSHGCAGKITVRAKKENGGLTYLG
ncbi:hypothetical protein [Thalassobacillus sp. B23F22_16]|uniref:hypothetical protein n=1 Tax=Thalassobacillus sp. B23F22_16 TaxID=3459513 RepID=UPI00373EA075